METKAFIIALIVFIVLEVLFFTVGSSLATKTDCLTCVPCDQELPSCLPCPCTTDSYTGIIGIVPSALVALLVYFLVKKFWK